MVRAHCRRGKITHGGANTLWGKRLPVCMLCAIVVVVLAGMVGSTPLPIDHLETPSSPAGAISSDPIPPRWLKYPHPPPPRIPPGGVKPPRHPGDDGLGRDEPFDDDSAFWKDSIRPSPRDREHWVGSKRAVSPQLSSIEDLDKSEPSDAGRRAAPKPGSKVPTQPPPVTGRAPGGQPPAADWKLFLSAQF